MGNDSGVTIFINTTKYNPTCRYVSCFVYINYSIIGRPEPNIIKKNASLTPLRAKTHSIRHNKTGTSYFASVHPAIDVHSAGVVS